MDLKIDNYNGHIEKMNEQEKNKETSDRIGNERMSTGPNKEEKNIKKIGKIVKETVPAFINKVGLSTEKGNIDRKVM